jgi:hypothetical protein
MSKLESSLLNSISHQFQIFSAHRSHFVEQIEVTSTSHCVNAVLSIHNLSQRVRRSRVIGIVDHNVVAIVTVCNDPVFAVVHVANYDVSLVQIGFYLTVCHFSLKRNSESVDCAPYEQVARYVTAILSEPLVQNRRIDVRLDCTCESH